MVLNDYSHDEEQVQHVSSHAQVVLQLTRDEDQESDDDDDDDEENNNNGGRKKKHPVGRSKKRAAAAPDDESSSGSSYRRPNINYDVPDKVEEHGTTTTNTSSQPVRRHVRLSTPGAYRMAGVDSDLNHDNNNNHNNDDANIPPPPPPLPDMALRQPDITAVILDQAAMVAEIRQRIIDEEAVQAYQVELEHAEIPGKHPYSRRTVLCLIGLFVAVVLIVAVAAVSATISVMNNKKDQDKRKGRAFNAERLLDFLKANSLDQGLALEDTSSPQHQAYRWLMNDPTSDMRDPSVALQRYAMAVFYHSTGGKHWTQNDGWLTSRPTCDWFNHHDQPCRKIMQSRRIDSNKDDSEWDESKRDESNRDGSNSDNSGRDGSNVDNSVPNGSNMDNSVPDGSNMNNSGRDGSNMDNSIPNGSGGGGGGGGKDMFELIHLALPNNNLTGTLPPEMHLLLRSLVSISLPDNNLRGPLPPLAAADGDDGSVPILKYFDLSNNHLTGSLPASMGTAFPDLQILALNSNNMVGSIPSEWSALSELIVLSLPDNALTGTIPTQLADSLGQLQFLALTNNHFQGTMPPFASSSLKFAYLDGNDLTGSIPDSFCSSAFRLTSDCNAAAEVTCRCCTYCCGSSSGSGSGSSHSDESQCHWMGDGYPPSSDDTFRQFQWAVPINRGGQ